LRDPEHVPRFRHPRHFSFIPFDDGLHFQLFSLSGFDGLDVPPLFVLQLMSRGFEGVQPVLFRFIFRVTGSGLL
jgi:hypothetical protein